MNKLYSVHDHWTDINKKNDVDIESIDGVITGIKVNGEDYGGSTWNKVFTGNVVTSGEASPFIGTINVVLNDADTIKVFYNSTEYILPKQVGDYGIVYGATPGATPEDIDFSEYPFLIRLGEVSTVLYTQSPGPQDLTIFEPSSGGGESDFSTVQVAIDNESNEDINLNLIPVPVVEHITQEEGSSAVMLLPNGLMSSGDTETGADANSTEVYKFLLAKDSNFAITSNWGAEVPNNITVSGNAEKSYIVEQGQNYPAIIITGDCTITIS